MATERGGIGVGCGPRAVRIGLDRLPEFRGQGIGRTLMRFLAHLANERGCGRMEWSVLDWNERAIEFYQSLGAQVMPDWRICRLTGEALRRHA